MKRGRRNAVPEERPFRADFFAAFRERVGVSLEGVAKTVGTGDKGLISRWQSGKRTPRKTSIVKLAEAYDISWELFYRTERLNILLEHLEAEIKKRGGNHAKRTHTPPDIGLGALNSFTPFRIHDAYHDLYAKDLENTRLLRVTNFTEFVVTQWSSFDRSEEMTRRAVLEHELQVRRIEVIHDLSYLRVVLERAHFYRQVPARFLCRIAHPPVQFPVLNMVSFDDRVVYLGAYNFSADPNETALRIEGVSEISELLIRYFDVAWERISARYQIRDPYSLTPEVREAIILNNNTSSSQIDDLLKEIRSLGPAI